MHIHTIPIQDSGHKHTKSPKCGCKPTLETIKDNVVVTHNMIGDGPDEWVIRIVEGKEAKQ